MFEIRLNDHGDVILAGRFDASQVETAKAVFNNLSNTAVVDFKDLKYISSAGLGVLMMTQKRLSEAGGGLKLKNMNNHIRDVFQIARFDLIFDIE